VAGALALSKKGAIDAGCRGAACSPDGKRAADAAQSLAAVSTATFIGGVAAIGVGGVLFVLSPAKRPSASARAP
ncbi:MAG TPA: hypothetical protein VHB21_01545, partial [Minicystis sp.]|nr:hypothetical protein [Minicystis sp.]